MKPYTVKDRKQKVELPLEAVIQQYGNTTFDARTFCNGSMIIGSTGSGKSSGPLDSITLGLFMAQPRMGGVITCAKQDDIDKIKERIVYAGREDDVIYVDATGDKRIASLEMARQLTPVGSSQAVSILEAVKTFMQLNNGGNSANQDPFWESNIEKFIIAASILLICAGEKVSFKNMLRILNTMPHSDADLDNADFLAKSYCIQLINKTEQNVIETTENLDISLTYFLQTIIRIESRTLSNIIATIHAALFPATIGLFANILDDVETNFSTSMTFEGKIIVLNFPPSVYYSEGNRVLGMFYYLWMKDVMSRDLNVSNRCVFSVVDECQLIVNDYMIHFSSICRSQNCIVVYATQSLASIEARLNRMNGKVLVSQWMSNMGFKFMLCATDPSTIDFYKSVVGRDYEFRVGFNASLSAGNNSSNAHEDYRDIIPEKEFRLLATGGEKNGYIVECILICAGTTFDDGETYMRVAFEQRKIAS
ncbi:TraM recognition domain-containing protein [Seonamhaeicola marinus]|nr:TraM recognition domain-containing protein [Seonamhaeicola marinus]